MQWWSHALSHWLVKQASPAGVEEGIWQGRNKLCAAGSLLGVMLVIIQLFCLTVVSISYVFHWMIVLLDLCPTVFIYV